MESSGVHGGTGAPTSMPDTGSDTAGHLGIAILFVITGALLVLITRRELDDQAVA
jgi:LPXTG-motif cell wall-anchored protein